MAVARICDLNDEVLLLANRDLAESTYSMH